MLVPPGTAKETAEALRKLREDFEAGTAMVRLRDTDSEEVPRDVTRNPNSPWASLVTGARMLHRACRATLPMPSTSAEEVPSPAHANMVHLTEAETDGSIVYDTGAAAHMIRDLDLVRAWVSPAAGRGAEIRAFGGSVVHATHIGEVPGFGRVYVTPRADITLIAGSELDRNGYNTTIAYGMARITHSFMNEAHVKLSGRWMYEMTRVSLLVLLGDASVEVLCNALAQTRPYTRATQASTRGK